MRWRKRKVLGVESAGKGVGEGGPPGPAKCKRQGIGGTCGSGPRRRLIQEAGLTSERQDQGSGLLNPGFEIHQNGKADADGFGDTIGRLARGKPPGDKQNIVPKPSAERRKEGGKNGVGFAARGGGAAVDRHKDDFGGQMGPLTGMVIVEKTFGVVAGRTGDYIWPRMCGGDSWSLVNPKIP